MFDVLEEFKALTREERQFIFVALLSNGDIDYTELSETYVTFLKNQANDNGRKLTKAVQWITSYWNGGRHAKSEFVKAGAAYFIVKNGYMKGAAIEKEMKAYLESHLYEEDENGMPRTELG